MKLWASFYKELLILIRDRAGLAILFIMPALLIIILQRLPGIQYPSPLRG